MTRRGSWTWVLDGLLALALAGRLAARTPQGTGFSTLPILVPVSLGYEAELRALRGQPVQPLPEVSPAMLARGSAEGVAALQAARQRLFDLRDRRHALNVRLMGVGVEVARELEPAQWEVVVMQRDALRARAEAATFARVLAELEGAR